MEEERARCKVEEPGLTQRQQGVDDEKQDEMDGGQEETAVEATGEYLAQLSPSFTFTYFHKAPTWRVGLT